VTEPERVSSELRRLVSLTCDGQLAPEEHARLEEILLQDASARAFYREYLVLHGELAWSEVARRGATPKETRQAPVDLVAAPDHPLLGPLEAGVQHGVGFFSRSIVLSLLFAVVLPAVVLLVLVVDMARQAVAPAPAPVAAAPAPAAPSPVAVAAITRSHQCVWGGKTAELPQGTKLIGGTDLELKEGLAEIAFADGASVILRGPAKFRVHDSRSGLLDLGSLAATVAAPAAHGFTIQTPLATVVDRGTEFGVCVRDDGISEAHVFAGQVEVATRATQGQPAPPFKNLSAGEAAKIHRAGAEGAPQVEMIASAPEEFIRRVPPASNAGLREPRILFAHRGDRDPTSEGWKVAWPTRAGRQFDGSTLKEMRQRDFTLGPAGKGAAPAWGIDDRSGELGASYQIWPAQGMTPELVAEAETKGWVLRSRLMVASAGTSNKSMCFCSFWGGGRQWGLRLNVDRDGNQRVLLQGSSSLGKNTTITVPRSRDRYVDYEVRYDPRTKDADVYVDGKLVATGFHNANPSQTVLHFGTSVQGSGQAKFAQVEWGILDH